MRPRGAAHLHHVGGKAAHRPLLHRDDERVLPGHSPKHVGVERLAEASVHHGRGDARLQRGAARGRVRGGGK